MLPRGITQKSQAVLILVLVEDGFGVGLVSLFGISMQSLNPCFSGRWFRSQQNDGG